MAGARIVVDTDAAGFLMAGARIVDTDAAGVLIVGAFTIGTGKVGALSAACSANAG